MSTPYANMSLADVISEDRAAHKASQKKPQQSNNNNNNNASTNTENAGPKCFACGETGHKKSACARRGQENSNGSTRGNDSKRQAKCFNCNQTGHKKADCNKSQQVTNAPKCFNCNQTGHKKADCNKSQQVTNGPKCFNCNQTGHKKADCNKSQQVTNGPKCFNCGNYGHKKSDCSQQYSSSTNSRGEKKCNECGRVGHIKKDCRDVVCDTCQGRGHMSFACPQSSSSNNRGHNARSRSPGRDRNGHRNLRDDSATVVVSNLSSRTTGKTLKAHFEGSGLKVSRFEVTGGTGSLSFSNSEDAQEAVDAFNDTELDGRVIRAKLPSRRRNNRR